MGAGARQDQGEPAEERRQHGDDALLDGRGAHRVHVRPERERDVAIDPADRVRNTAREQRRRSRRRPHRDGDARAWLLLLRPTLIHRRRNRIAERVVDRIAYDADDLLPWGVLAGTLIVPDSVPDRALALEVLLRKRFVDEDDAR